jgi:hypothetical protein
MRSFWYMAMTALEDEETQKQGIVFLSYAVGQPVLQRSGVFKLSNIFSVLPLRIVGIHVCVDDPKARLLATFATLLIESRHRVRFRCHCGKQTKSFPVLQDLKMSSSTQKADYSPFGPSQVQI